MASMASPAFMSSSYLNKHFYKPQDDPPPLCPTPSVKQNVRVVEAKPLPKGMPILVIYNRFIELILRGIKTVEMRAKSSTKVGQRIALCVSGAGSRADGFVVLGTAFFRKALCKADLAKGAWGHWVKEASCVGSTSWPAKYQWCYVLEDVEAFDRPVMYKNPLGHKGESTDWRTFGRSWVYKDGNDGASSPIATRHDTPPQTQEPFDTPPQTQESCR